MPKTARKKMDDYRARLRAQGLRPVQLWVPDVRAPGFADEARRQSRLVSGRKSEQADIAFVEALQGDNLDLPET